MPGRIRVVARGAKRCVGLPSAGGQRAQRREVVQDPDRAAVRAGDQVGPLDQQVVDRRDRQVELEALPVRAVVERDVEAGLGAGVEQPLAARDRRG